MTPSFDGELHPRDAAGEVTVPARTWNLKSGISESGILAPSKFHDVEMPRFQQKSWNREFVFEAHTRKLVIVILAYTAILSSQYRYTPWKRNLGNLGIWDFDRVSNAAGGRHCNSEFRNFTKAGA